MIVLMFVLLFAAPAMGVGVSPARIEENFVPGFERSYTLYLYNSIDVPLEVEIYVTGDLAEYITINTSRMILAPKEIRPHLMLVKLPDVLEPGRRDTAIGILETQSPEAAVGARAGVEMQYWVTVPLPEKYVSIGLGYEPKTPKTGEPVMMTATLNNPTEPPLNATADIEIQDSTRTTFYRSELGYAFLFKDASRTFYYNWTPESYGTYYAVSRAYYDGLTTKKTLKMSFTEPKQAAAPPSAEIPLEVLPDLTLYIIIIAVLAVGIGAVLLWPSEGRRKG